MPHGADPNKNHILQSTLLKGRCQHKIPCAKCHGILKPCSDPSCATRIDKSLADKCRFFGQPKSYTVLLGLSWNALYVLPLNTLVDGKTASHARMQLAVRARAHEG
mmetsp:Transcript_49904/g.82175  ORF Transcript_49904/g.82175 Transcript_49904/m.82175 type:complete len:106 (-) Transcript_49904:1458-1775(-)